MILNILQRHTLFHELETCRDFYTMTMKSGEKVSSFIGPIERLAFVQTSMGVSIDDSEISMSVLNELPDEVNGIITALDVYGEKSLSLDLVKSRLLHKEQKSALQKSSSSGESVMLHSYEECPNNQEPH